VTSITGYLREKKHAKMRDNSRRVTSFIGMAQMLSGIPKSSWFHHIGKSVAVAASTGAALISILTALFSYGVLGKSESHLSIGNLGAAWVRLGPAMDTATAIGDTIYFAATIADKNGSILVGARPTWTTGDSTVAIVRSDGAVIARGPGQTTVSAVVGALVARSQILVKQRVAGVVVSSTVGDTAVVLPEETKLHFRARSVDARGHTVARSSTVKWHVDDTVVAEIDAKGVLNGRNAGRTVVSANIEGASGYLGISVVTTAAALTPVGGNHQRALAGRALPQKVVVRATNRRGMPAAGKTVTFRLSDGQGSVEPLTATTDADGRARTTWTLGHDPGRQTLLANVENLDSALAIVAEADPVPTNTRATAVVEQLRARAGDVIADSVAVRVTDSTGRALADVPVGWVTLQGGSIEGVAARTDSQGVARARWTLANKTGTQHARAQIGSGSGGRGITPVTISATALAGAPAAIAVVAGDGQRAAAGSVLPKAIVLRVVDASGNGAADVPVVLSPSSGNVPDTALRTDSLGMARTRWTMGRSAGSHALGVHVAGIKKLLKLSARATPAKPANLSFDDAPTAAKVARTKTKNLIAVVTDVYGNPIPDAPVTFSVKSGSVTPARAVTDARGRVRVRWMLGAKSGEQTLSGVVRGTDVNGRYVTHVAAPTAATKTASVKPRGR
jgi:hypothetical protein